MSADIFLMGTAGRFDDPNRSAWREPIKKACANLGISCFDPVVPEWNEEAGRREAEALRSAKIIVLAITADTVGMASLAESGWTVLSAVMRKQAIGLWVDPQYRGEKIELPTTFVRQEDIQNTGQMMETLEEASRRARKLVNSHAISLRNQFPTLNLYVARNLDELTKWTVETARKLIEGSKQSSSSLY